METYLKKKTKVTKDDFKNIADIILNKTILLVNQHKYRITEIEFYLKSEEHEDSYTHCNKDQLEYGCWYFHRYHNGTYKAGTYKCMDLTLGNKKENKYCGVLIRSIYDIDNKNIIEGPCRTVNAILASYNCDSIGNFVGETILNVLDNEREFVVKNSTTNLNPDLKQEVIYSGPRIGLSDKYPEYQSKSYRFAIFHDKIKKMKKTLKRI